VDQTTTRLEITAYGGIVLVHAISNSDLSAVKDLNGDERLFFIDSSIENRNVKQSGEVFLFYECRCSEEMISRMVEKMSKSDRRDLFGDRLQLEIECPRCGRKYTVTRKDRKVY
jgi:redox-regulated HSP33 family molecular chaperone